MGCMNGAMALGFLGALVEEELRLRKLEGPAVAQKAGIHPAVVENVKTGKANQHRADELRRLINVLFLAGTKKRARAWRLMFHIVPTGRSFRSLPYRNRKAVRRGKLSFARF